MKLIFLIFVFIPLTANADEWCEWTTCRYGKCEMKKESYLTPQKMSDLFIRLGPGWKITYECWPTKEEAQIQKILAQ